jgi:signal transduction histidine kinase
MLVYGDKVQLQQVALNLVRNATEAMRDVKGRPRVLTIETAIRSDMVCVGVHDTGSGIPLRDRQRLFEALYTTKTSGLGMGLAICRKIIAAHEGKIWLEDNAPHGTSFHFMLPVQCRQD